MTSNESIHRSQNKFRMAAKSFFLTYPQCNCSKEDLKNFLLAKRPTDYILIGQETHKDGGLHLHCLVSFKKKLNIKSDRFFDFNEFHPNIQATKNPAAVKNYIRKEDIEPLEFSDIAADLNSDDNLYNMARTTGEEDFFETCRTNKVSIHP